jgi:hypothetical protein
LTAVSSAIIGEFSPEPQLLVIRAYVLKGSRIFYVKLEQTRRFMIAILPTRAARRLRIIYSFRLILIC